MNLAVIPARGGSKRIPQKNIRLFAGKPIIAYSIEAARKADVFDEIIVSTDCDQIAEVAEECGASVPFRRPPELSDDHTPTIPVVRHAITWARQAIGNVERVCCIYATAPFIRPEDIRSGCQRLESTEGALFAFSVTSFAFPIFRALKIEHERVAMFWPEHQLTRSQDLPEAYHDAGQFYWGTAEGFMSRDGVFSSDSIPIVLPRHRVQDIDTQEDWDRAERLYQASNGANDK